MKTKCLAFAFALSAAAMFAGPPSVLVMDSSPTARSRAVIGDMSVIADSITFDSRGDQLHCTGSVEVHRDGVVVKTSDCVVELPARSTVYRLDPKGVQITPNKSREPTATAVTPPATQEPRRP